MTKVAKPLQTSNGSTTKLVQLQPLTLTGEITGRAAKGNYWGVEFTYEFKKIIAILERAKRETDHYIIIAETGAGKTFTKDCFMKRHPKHSYCITVDSLYRVPDIIDELLRLLQLPITGTPALRKKAIVQRLREIKMSGGHPVLLIDEGENMKLPTLQMLKGLYDSIKMHCAMVLIGTHQLKDMLERLCNNDKKGVPQFYRRFKAGIRTVHTNNKDMGLFLDKYVADKGLKKLLLELCDNYGELNGYLEPALREADRMKQPLTEDFFRIVHDMPRYAQKAI